MSQLINTITYYFAHIDAPGDLYMGCFKDAQTKDLPYDILNADDESPMSLEKCMSHCRERHNTYSAVRAGYV